MANKQYNIECIGLAGLQKEFKLCHIPFLVVDDVFGALALEGSSGTGKTTLVKRLGMLNQKVTGGPVGVFSADKANYEDFVGCPIPDPQTKEMCVYKMPYAVANMETLLVDEINRASVGNQEKWLSLLATRVIDSTPARCRYIYAAMNPILRDKNSNDTYEGVIPLDKALGERIMGLITMPAYSALSPEHRIAVLRLSNNQAKWEPTDEAISLHVDFLAKAREEYAAAKERLDEQVNEYIDNFHMTLKEGTKGALSVEARRAQYMKTNLMAVYALNKVSGIGSLESAALEAMLISFPNPLWEQPINPIALKEAHNLHVHLLKRTASERKKSTLNWAQLSQSAAAVLAAANQKVSKEEFTKVVMSNWPASDSNLSDHYLYAYAAVKAFGGGKKGTQKLLKEEEFSRLQKVYDVYMDTNRYAQYRQVMEHLKTNHTFPNSFKIPSFISDDPAFDNNSGQMMTKFTKMLETDLGVTAMTQATAPGMEITTFAEFATLSMKMHEVLRTFKNAAAAYSPSI